MKIIFLHSAMRLLSRKVHLLRVRYLMKFDSIPLRHLSHIIKIIEERVASLILHSPSTKEIICKLLIMVVMELLALSPDKQIPN